MARAGVGAAGAVGAAGVAAGAAVARASAGPTLVPWPNRVRTAFPIATGVSTGLTLTSVAGALVSTVVRRRLPVSGRGILTGAAVAVALGAGGRIAARAVIGRISAKGRELDPAFASPPPSEHVSGGPGSALAMAELGREGARFVWTHAVDADVKAVVGKKLKRQPVRVFVGFDAASTPEQRVGLAMAELRRTGAFDRALLLVVAPAGTGYANPTPVDVAEILMRGDCAAVSVAYGVLPSFLSLGRVDLAARTQGLLLQAIADEVASRPRKQRPRVLLYGESLGARVAQAAIPNGPADLDRLGIDTALFVGTPGGLQSDAFHEACRDVSWTLDNPEQLPTVMPEPRPRVWFLEHDGDPVVRFRRELAAERPVWLPVGGERGRNVPESMTWRPGVTWAQVLVDVLFATNVKPGDFQSLGHDYRADLGPVTSTAFGLLPDDPDERARVVSALDDRLRSIEVERARLIDEVAGATGVNATGVVNRDESGGAPATA